MCILIFVEPLHQKSILARHILFKIFSVAAPLGTFATWMQTVLHFIYNELKLFVKLSRSLRLGSVRQEIAALLWLHLCVAYIVTGGIFHA